jgi:hypothetical protein
MPKPVPLNPSLVDTPHPAPPAATHARGVSKTVKPAKPEQIPLQVRLPRAEVRAIKIAAAERDQTISDFMLACFHAYMK